MESSNDEIDTNSEEGDSVSEVSDLPELAQVRHVPYKCEYCTLTFRKKAKYVRHLRTHTKEVLLLFFLFCRNPLCAHFPAVESVLVGTII